MDLKELEILGSQAPSHWYYQAKYKALTKVVGGATGVLDVGSGSGLFPRRMLEDDSASWAVCVDPGYATDRDEIVNGKPFGFRRSIDTTQADLVLMMDVLEHVSDDVALVREYVDKVASGTRFLVTVPAFSWLWSGHDDFLEHYRRYTIAGLDRSLSRGGLIVDKKFYYYGLLFPIAATSRLASRLRGSKKPGSALKPVHPLVNSMLLAACRMELPFFQMNGIAGLTAMALARKP